MDDKALRQNVLDELDYEPSIDAAHIGVAVHDGFVTLSGHVPTYVEKLLAERAVRRVKGVRAVAEQLTVELGASNSHTDDLIGRRALTVLDLNVIVPSGAIQVKVKQGWLTLRGAVEWEFQRAAALNDLLKLRGVVGITNAIKVEPLLDAGDIEQRIGAALKRMADGEVQGVKVSVHEGVVTLEGPISTWTGRCAVERAAWAAPGVRSIDDRLVVS